MIYLPALPPFFAIIFSLFPLFVWWVKLYPHIRIIAGISFFSIAVGFIFPSLPWLTFILGGVFLLLSNKKVDHPHKAFKFSNRWIKFPLEAILIWIVYLFFKLLPLKIASNIGAKIGKFAGEKLKSRTKLALKNLQHVFPENKKNHQKIVDEMWENLGRTIGEIPHLKEVAKITTIEGLDIFKKLKGKPYLVAVAHLSSVGLASHPLFEINQKASLFIRSANNPLTSVFLEKAFGGKFSQLSFLSKGREGMIQAIKDLKNNIPIAIASDLHIKGGEKLLFLGKEAETSTVLVKLAEKFKCPIVPFQVIRKKNQDHTVIIHEPIFVKPNSTFEIMQKINNLIGDWIKENPSQWFWINNRWNL